LDSWKKKLGTWKNKVIQKHKENEPYAEYRFCCETEDGKGFSIDGIWFDITKDTTPQFLQDGLDFLNSHTCLQWRIEYR